MTDFPEPLHATEVGDDAETAEAVALEPSDFNGFPEPAGPLDVGAVVRATAQFIREHGVFAIGVSVLFAAPESAYVLFRAFTVPSDWTAINNWLDGAHDLPLIVGTLLSMFASLTLAFAVYSFQQQEAWTPLAYMRQGMNAIGRGMVMQMAVGIAVLLGVVALVLPAFVVGAATFIAVPLVAIEKCSVPDAFNRCFSLTRGHRWRIGLLALVVILLPVGIYLLAYMSIFPSDDLLSTEADWLFRIRLAAVLEVLFNAVMTTSAGVLSAMIYTALVRTNKAVDTEALQEIFA